MCVYVIWGFRGRVGESSTYERPDRQSRRDGGDGARADVARYPAAGGQEGEEEGVRRGAVVLVPLEWGF